MRWQTLGLVALFALGSTACSNSVSPSVVTTPAPPNIALQTILSDCWGVTQLQALDGTRPNQTRAFECARARLLQMARLYPDAAEPHRLLGWGYYFALQNEDAARAEYERAAEIYRERGLAPEQAEMLVQLAYLALKYDPARGCALVQQAVTTDPTNTRAPQLLRNFTCAAPATPISTPTNS